MKYSITTKFLAIFLAALMLATAAASVLGIVIMSSMDLYATDFESWREQLREDRAYTIARRVSAQYATEALSDLTQEELAFFLPYESDSQLSSGMGLKENSWSYRICQTDGKILRTGDLQLQNADVSYTFNILSEYPSKSDRKTGMLYYGEDGTPLFAEYVTGPEYTVTVDMEQDVLLSYNGVSIGFLELFFSLRYILIVALLVSLLLFAVCTVYLCCAAGKTHKDAAPNPGGLNRLPLDLYLAVAVVSCVLLGALAIFLMDIWFYDNGSYNLAILCLAAVILLVAAVIVIGFFFALAAQVKTPRFFWWHHSIIGWCIDKLWRGIRFVFRFAVRLLGMLPLIWKYLLLGSALMLVPLLLLVLAMEGSGIWVFLLLITLLSNGGVIAYGAFAFGSLQKGAKKMADGSLNTKINTRYLIGSYKECAQHLNALADTATVAAHKQMQSERMKTELITNVSHDIKTPLTSIINYVDLLEKADSPEQTAQYLEVLGRQSQRLKKLIEDLMEMSKATTGNLAVEIGTVDAVETVNQALGEFADKLTLAQLQPIFVQPEESLLLQADGRLTWRVLSNLLSNIVKYAQPGTRVYVDLAEAEGYVCLSLKNISREPLNISAQELTERFVRGDASRNTEGSGLGLNIAKSLMELQKGRLELLVDGDLFKVTLMFPKA